jgi:hypothetical protein
MTYLFDNANRYTAVCGTFKASTTNYTGSTCSGTLTTPTVTYATSGAMAGATFGGVIAETTAFNSRFQPSKIQAGALLRLGYCACRKLGALAKCPRTRESEETNSRGLLGAKGYRDSTQRSM